MHRYFSRNTNLMAVKEYIYQCGCGDWFVLYQVKCCCSWCCGCCYILFEEKSFWKQMTSNCAFLQFKKMILFLQMSKNLNRPFFMEFLVRLATCQVKTLSQNVTKVRKCHIISLNVNKCHKMVLNITKWYLISQNGT